MLRRVTGCRQPLSIRIWIDAICKVMAALLFSAVAVGATACAKQQAPVTSVDPRLAPHQKPSRVAGQVYYRVETEDDGMEAQHPPALTKVNEPDDPTEPFSPNYGRSPVSMPAEQPAKVSAAAAL